MINDRSGNTMPIKLLHWSPNLQVNLFLNACDEVGL